MKKIIASVFLSVALCGCIYKGAKITEGVDFMVGVKIPATEGVGELSIINYVSGFRCAVATDSKVTVDYHRVRGTSLFDAAETNSFRAVIEPLYVGPDCACTTNGASFCACTTNETAGCACSK